MQAILFKSNAIVVAYFKSVRDVGGCNNWNAKEFAVVAVEIWDFVDFFPILVSTWSFETGTEDFSCRLVFCPSQTLVDHCHLQLSAAS